MLGFPVVLRNVGDERSINQDLFFNQREKTNKLINTKTKQGKKQKQTKKKIKTDLAYAVLFLVIASEVI